MKIKALQLHGLLLVFLIDAGFPLSLFAAAATKEPDIGDQPSFRNEKTHREKETLTDKQIGQVKTILSKYDANMLTADEAKAIHEAFRQAGLRRGPALNDAVKAAGFNPDNLRDFAPPPEQGGDRDKNSPSRKDANR